MPPHRSNGDVLPPKGRNFGNTSSSPPAPLVVISSLYFVHVYIVLYHLIALVVVVVCIIYVVHLVAHLDNLSVAKPNL